MRFTTPDGKEWRYVDQGYALGPCYTMTPEGIIMVAAGESVDGPIVAPARREYTFGGVVFEKDPEGGWYTWEGAYAVYPYLFPCLKQHQFRVRPVRVVGST